MERILLPSIIGGEFGGFFYLNTIQKRIASSTVEQIVIDCSQVRFFGANLCAVLAGIVSEAQSKGKRITFENVTGRLQDIWNRNHFLPIDPRMMAVDLNRTVVHFKRFAVNDDDGFRKYIHSELLSKQDMPFMSLGARKKIQESIYEIFSNAVIHSGCSEILTCGQYYPNKHTLEFTIVDMGKTIRANVSSFLGSEVSGQTAIKWAAQEGKTTKKGSIPGGLGLSIIRRFLSLNNGKLQIASSDGYWEEYNGYEYTRESGGDFPGTIVNLTFNMQDNNGYQLDSEPDDVPLF